MTSQRTAILLPAISRENGVTKCALCSKTYPDSSSNKNSHWEKHIRSSRCKSETEDNNAKLKLKNSIIKRLDALEEDPQMIEDFGIQISHNLINLDEMEIQESKRMKSKIDEEEMNTLFIHSFAQFFFNAGLPLHLIECERLSTALRILLPSIKLPSRKELSNKILKEEYEKVKKNTFKSINKMFCEDMSVLGTILIDGWTGTSGDAVISFIYSSPLLNRPIYITSCFPGTLSVSSTYIAEVTKKVIKYIGINKVSCITSDGEASFVKSKELLLKDFPGLKSATCINHIIANIAKELEKKSSNIRTAISNALEITLYFKNHHYPSALFKKATKRGSLSVPAATRWFSNLKMLENLHKHMSSLLQIVHSPDFHFKNTIVDSKVTLVPLIGEQLEQSKKIKLLIESSELFWSKVFLAIEVLSPLQNICKKNEQFFPPIQDIYPDLAKYNQYIESLNVKEEEKEVKEHLKIILEKRLSQVMENKIYLIAHALDPIQRGSMLGINYLNTISDMSNFFPANLHEEFQNEFTKYRIFILNTSNQYKKATTNHHLIHHFMEMRPHFPLVSQLGANIFSVVSSNSSVERHFSSFSFIHRNLRNRLSLDRAKMLTFIYQNSKVFHEHESEEEQSNLESQLEQDMESDGFINEYSSDSILSTEVDDEILGFI